MALANWKSSSSASTCAVTSCSRPRIHASASVSELASEPSAPAVDGRGSAGEAPLASANRAAFHSFVPKLRAAATLSSPIGASTPGLATRASAKRVASVP